MTHLNVQLITSTNQLTSKCLEHWNQLAKHPLQRWEWLGTWAQAFPQQYQPYILKFTEGDRIVGFAPWCTQQRLTTGRTLEFLGSGKACTDHQSLLVDDHDAESVCLAAADWLTGAHPDCSHCDPKQSDWDSLEWSGVDASDRIVAMLVDALRERDITLDSSPGENCYAIALPESWEAYVGGRSKSGRREIRQSLKQIDDGTLTIRRAERASDLHELWPTFIDLHQRRREVAGTDGCFDYPEFAAFLRTAAVTMLEAGLLEFWVASAGENPVAVHFAFVDDNGWYFYQSGMDPDAADLRPGLSTFCHALRTSIESGRTCFDLMRGEESYKTRWRADQVATLEIRGCNTKLSAKVRQQVYQTGVTFKQLIKSGLGIQSPSH